MDSAESQNFLGILWNELDKYRWNFKPLLYFVAFGAGKNEQRQQHMAEHHELLCVIWPKSWSQTLKLAKSITIRIDSQHRG